MTQNCETTRLQAPAEARNLQVLLASSARALAHNSAANRAVGEWTAEGVYPSFHRRETGWRRICRQAPGVRGLVWQRVGWRRRSPRSSAVRRRSRAWSEGPRLRGCASLGTAWGEAERREVKPRGG